MEVQEDEQPAPPSWLSIVTKRKRFGEGDSPPTTPPPPQRVGGPGTDDSNDSNGYNGHPKKNKRLRVPSNGVIMSGGEGEGLASSSLGLLRQRSSSTGEQGSSKEGVFRPVFQKPSIPHSSHVALDLRRKVSDEEDVIFIPPPTKLPLPLAKFPNQISVIKSTSSYLQKKRPPTTCTEQPEDLSVKQKPKKRLPSDYDDDACVQDLSLPSHNKSSNNYTPATAILRTVPVVMGPRSLPLGHVPVAVVSSPEFILPDPCGTGSEEEEGTGELIIVTNDNYAKASNSSNNNGGGAYGAVLQEGHSFKNTVKPISPETNRKLEPADTNSNKSSESETETKKSPRRGRKRKDDDTAGSKFDCILCDFSSVKENVLKNHMVRMHTVKGNRGNVKCTVCGYSTPSLEELFTHQELAHREQASGTKGGAGGGGGEPSEKKVAFHACSHCTKKFRSQSQLEAHLRLITQKQMWKDLKGRSKKLS